MVGQVTYRAVLGQLIRRAYSQRIFDKFLHLPEMHILASAGKYFVEIFCGTRKGLDEKGKHNIGFYLPAESVQNSQHFDLVVLNRWLADTIGNSHALCTLHT